jgi:hypothetical protein
MRRFPAARCLALSMLAGGATLLAAETGGPAAESPAAESSAISVWEVPKDADPAGRDGWKPAGSAEAFPGGAALENGRIAAVVLPGGEGVVVVPRDRGIKAATRISPVLADGTVAKVSGVKPGRSDRAGAELKVAFGGDAIVMCVWQGALSGSETKDTRDAAKDPKEGGAPKAER